MKSLVAFVPIVAAWDGWTDCGSATDLATLNGVRVSPDPPVKGVPLTFNFDLTVKEQIEGGSIVVNLKAGDVVPVPINVNDDLCADLAQIGLACPVPVGPFTFTISDETIPKLFPEKHVYGNVHLTRSDSKQIACIKLDAIIKATVNQTLDQPHLSQAWQALSSGDGLPDQIGLETYIYDEVGEWKAHKWDYGAKNCIKIELDTPFTDKEYPPETYYIACDAVNCCKEKTAARPDLKQWDIAQRNRFTKVQFDGYLDTTELNDAPITGAETWSEKHTLHILNVNYSYKIHREDSYAEDKAVRTHRIDYEAPGTAPGSILYGNFIQIKDLEAAKAIFKPPPECLKDNTLFCPDNHASQYFKHATMLKQLKQRVTVV